MKGTAKHKVVSSGRLTGAVKGQPVRSRVTQKPVSWTEPHYSLYSTDSEDQVTTIHNGLDRCAALLTGILQAERAEAKPSPARAVRSRAAKPKTSTSMGKRTTKKPVTKKAPVQKSILASQSHPGLKASHKSSPVTVHCEAVSPALRKPVQSTAAADPGCPARRHPSLSRPPSRANPQPSPSDPGTDVHFSGLLTTSTPTLSPEKLVSSGTEHPANTKALRQGQASSARTIAPGEPQPENGTSRALTSALGASAARQTQGTPTLPASQCSGTSSGSVPLCELRTPWPKPLNLRHSHMLNSQSQVAPPPQPQTSIPLSRCQASIPDSQVQTSNPLCLSQSQPLYKIQQPSSPCGLSRTSEPLSGEHCGHQGASSGGQEEEEHVPVKDTNSLSISDKHSHIRDTDSHTQTCTVETPAPSNLGQQDTLHQPIDTLGTHSTPSTGWDACTAEMEVKVKEVQYLLRELRPRITGQDGVAERLLNDLEQTVSLLPLQADSSNIQAEIALILQPLYSQNTQLRRRLRILNQQLKERERAERESMGRQSNSEVLALQAELSAAQTQVRELQDDITELRQALQDTQSQLRDREAADVLVRTDLETASRRLAESERQRSEVALLAQQRLEEIQNLNRILQSRVSSDSPKVTDSRATCLPLTRQLLDQHQHGQDPSEPVPDAVSQYLNTLGRSGRALACRLDSPLEPTADVGEVVGRSVCVSEQEEGVRATAEGEARKLTCVPQEMMSLHPPMRSQHEGDLPVAHCQSLDTVFRLLHQSNPHAQSSGRQLGRGQRLSFDSSLSRCDVGSVLSDWSVGSGSTFDTRDEEAFRDGLAALDASIASLQRTIKMDLGR